MNEIEKILTRNGPCRSSKIVEILKKKFKISEETARQQISRTRGKVLRFPIPLLPNREAFLYLANQRNTDQFWINFHAALRVSNSIYGLALDSLIAKGGIIKVEEFAVISGAPLALKKQVSSEKVARTLIASGVLEQIEIDGVECIVLRKSEIGERDYQGFKIKLVLENIILDGVREWCRKMGLASYNSIVCRSDTDSPRLVGPFKWDLTGPSYLLPLRVQTGKPGFLVADVFYNDLDEFSIKYFIRKAQLLNATLKNTRCIPILISTGFTGQALTMGHSEGIILTTPELLFGKSVAKGLNNLLETLKKAAAVASSNPNRLLQLIDQLKDIEGAAGNLRGILFELICAYIAKVQGGSIDIGITAKDPESEKTADIDVLRVPNKGECVAIECKGKNPGGIVTLTEVENWIKRIPIFLAHLRNELRFSEAKISFEIWTTGTFHPDALSYLQKQKIDRKRYPISWKDGKDVFNISKAAKEKTINNALKEHFINHPLSK